MSISPTERKSYEDRVREAREESEKKEAELIKRQAAELKRMEKNHAEEIAKMNDIYEGQLSSTQDHSRESLDHRDVKHREDIDGLREMYVENLRKKMEDNIKERREMEDTFHEESARQKKTSESQNLNLTEKQMNALQQKDAQLSDAERQGQVHLKRGIEDEHARMESANEKDRGALIKAYDQTIANKDYDQKQMRKSYQGQLANEKRTREAAQAKEQGNNYRSLESLRATNEAANESKQAFMADEVIHQREKYENKWDEKDKQIEAGDQDFRKTVSNRQDAEVRGRDIKLKELETKLNNEIVNGERRKNLEERHIQGQYENKYKDLSRQKDEVADSQMELTHNRVNDVRDEDLKVMRQAERDHRSQMTLINERNKEEREMTGQVHSDDIKTRENMTDRRIQKITKGANVEVKTAADRADRTIEQMHDIYDTRLDEQAQNKVTDQAKLMGSMNERFKSIEGKYQNKLDMTTAGYEDKIGQMKDNFEKEKKRIEDAYQQRLVDEQKGRKLDKTSVEQKYEAKIAQNDELYHQELDRVQKRHEEDLKAVASRYSRKV